MASSGCSILTLALAAVFSASSAISCILFLYLFSSLFFLCSYLELYFICICMFTFFLSVFIYRKKWVESDSKVKELQKSLNSALEKCAAERQGRIRAQQVLPSSLLLYCFYSLQYCYLPFLNYLLIRKNKYLQALRKAVVAQPKCENSEMTSYPMAPIGIIQSCFSTR